MKVAINGFGRIGRLVFRIMMDDPSFDVVAINDLTNASQLAYLLKYDTNHRNYDADVRSEDNYLIVNGKRIRVFSEVEPMMLPWKDLGIDIVFECTGKFVDLESSNKHILAGAKKVIISAPGKGDMKTVVYNVNQNILDGSENIISASSCTTNCLAPVLKVIDDNFGIIGGAMTTIHAYTNDQVILDVSHKKGEKARRGRAGALNIIPTSTGAAKSIGKVIPNLEGRLDGSSMRVPVGDGSVIDLTLILKKLVTKDMINECFEKNKNESLDITFDPIVSSDIIGSKLGGLVDGLLTNVTSLNEGQIVKVVAWYDNEMGYSYQMVRTAKYWLSL